MNINDLQQKIDEMNVPSDSYSILKGGLPNEQLCIVKNETGWEIYYSERGEKSSINVFDDETSACEYFLEKLKKYSRP